jgi:hypothetical protein
MSLSIFFNGFWGGFLERTDPNNVGFFLELFRRVFKTDTVISVDPNSADVLCESQYARSAMSYKKWKYSFFFTGESILDGWKDNEYSKYTAFLGGITNRKNTVKCPLFVSYLFCNPQHSITSVRTIPPNNSVCVVMGTGVTAGPRGVTRVRFLDKLQTNMRVIYGGRFRNNIGYAVGGDHNSKQLIDFYRQFRFVLCMENSQEEYYITEKICNGLFAGVIPVYWGSPKIHEYFNPKRYLCLKDGDSDESLIYTMMKMSDIEYMDMVNQPALIKPIGDIIDDITAGVCKLNHVGE